MSGSRWVVVPSWLSGSWRSFLCSSVYSCHLWSRAKANRILSRKHTVHSKYPLPTIQGTTQTWTSPDGQYLNQIDCSLQSNMDSCIRSAKKKKNKQRLKADCGSDHQIFIEKFRFKLKKVEKTTRPFRYDLNQIPYYHTVEMTNRFKGLALANRLPEDIWTEISSKILERSREHFMQGWPW